MKRTSIHHGLAAATLFVALTACAGGTPGGASDDDPTPPTPGHAYLSIVGDQNVFLHTGETATLTVKYHDEQGNPLAGEVSFALQGTTAGAHADAMSGVTDAQGLVRVHVTGPTQAAFQVMATAQYADGVKWNLAIAQGDQPAPPLDPSGVYQLDSQFDLASGLPGTVGDVVNAFIDMTDGPNDPATWLIDRALEQIGNGTLKSIVNSFRPLLDGYLNDLLLKNAPGFVQTIVNVGNDFGQVARKFGTVSTLTITKSGSPDVVLTATHSIDGFKFTIDSQTYEYSMAELSLGESKATGISVTNENDTKLVIADHQLPVSYGHVMLFALDNVIIPQLDPWAHNLTELLLDNVDCASVGQAISDYVGIGSPGTYQAACDAGLQFAGGFVEQKILSLDSTAAALAIHGEAKPIDATGDGKVDKLSGGLWEGNFVFGPAGSVLAKPDQKFIGTRMIQ